MQLLPTFEAMGSLISPLNQRKLYIMKAVYYDLVEDMVGLLDALGIEKVSFSCFLMESQALLSGWGRFPCSTSRLGPDVVTL